MAVTRPIERWRIALGVAGLLLIAGGPLHPDAHPELDFFRSTALMLSDPGWVPSHALMLASFVVLLAGLIGLVRSGCLTGRSATVARVATIGGVVAVVEGVLHLAAVVDAAALQAGTPTPILDAHLALAVVAYPAIGLPLAVLAWLGGRSRMLTHPLLGALGALGAFLHGIAAPVVVTTRDQQFSFLFQGAILFAIWLVAVGIGRVRVSRGASVRRSSASPT